MEPDDGIELALALANSLIKEKMFKPEAVYYAYLTWMLSRPFKENRPILAGIGEKTSTLLRTAVLACFGRHCELAQVTHWCALNVKITHPDPICVFTNEIYAVAVFFALKSGNPEELYEKTIEWGFKVRKPGKNCNWKPFLGRQPAPQMSPLKELFVLCKMLFTNYYMLKP